MFPIRFAPIFKSALWGGRHLRPMLGAESTPDPTGEAWLLSDVTGSESVVADGPLAGKTLRELADLLQERLLGSSKLVHGRFPLLLKLIDARQHLSIQVHPDDDQAQRLEPSQPAVGKTEAWVILQAESESVIFAGLQPSVTQAQLEQALRTGKVLEVMHQFNPKPGECIFLAAGTVHAIGAGLILFEIQQTSDITYRLYDWDRVDAKTGKPRALHIEKSLECVRFPAQPCFPQQPVVIEQHAGVSEVLVDSPFFKLIRHQLAQAYTITQKDECRALVVIEGNGLLKCAGQSFPLALGDTFVIPAAADSCECLPRGTLTVLECCLPRREL